MSYRRYLSPLIFCAVDYVAIVLAVHLALLERNLIAPENLYRLPDLYIYGWIPLGFLVFFARSKIYKSMQPYIDTVREIFWSIAFGFIAAVMVLYFTESSLLASRLFVVLLWLTMLVTVYACRTALCFLLKKRHLLYEPVLLIGAGKTAECVLRFFREDLGYRYEVLGIVDDNPISEQVTGKYPLYGSVEAAAEVVQRLKCQTVIITAPGMEREKLAATIAKVQPYVRNISYVPDLIGTPMAGVEAQVLFSEEVLLLHMKNNLAMRRNRVIKRVFDLVLTISGGILILPFLVAIALCIKLDSPGGVFHNAKRIGKWGKEFTCCKFRSMYLNSDEILRRHLAKNQQAAAEWRDFAKLRDYDPRVTKTGQWIRHYSLDELPQIWNVLKGEMSLVGPRPYLPREKGDIGAALSTITQALPGITGYWQVTGRNDVTFKERVAMDTWYVRNWSLWIDIYYLAKTVKAVFWGKGAY